MINLKATVMVGLLAVGSIPLLMGCEAIQPPKASIEVSPLHVSVKNLNDMTWKGCQLILNAKAGDSEGAYYYNLGDVAPSHEEVILLTQFAQKNGDRFIPVIKKVADVTLQCKQPLQPFHKSAS